MLRDILYLGPMGDGRLACSQFANSCANKINCVCCDLDSGIEMTTELRCAGASNMYFQIVPPEDLDRILGKVRPMSGLLDFCPSWLIKAARKGLLYWFCFVVNASVIGKGDCKSPEGDSSKVPS